VQGLIGTITAERKARQEAEKRADALVEYIEEDKRRKDADAEAARIPDYNTDPLGHLTERTSAAVEQRMAPVTGLVNEVAELKKILTTQQQREAAREAEVGWRNAFSVQESQATPQQRTAIEEFHTSKYQEAKARGYDDATAQQVAQDARFQVYMTGVRSGQQHGPTALMTLRQLAGLPTTAAPAAAQAQVPQQTPQVPPAATRTQRPQLVREPPPARGRRGDVGGDTLHYVVDNWASIPENKLDEYVGKIAKERGVSSNEAYRLVDETVTRALSA
jgi:hypothetical protein